MSAPIEPEYVLLGQRIRHLREMNGMTQETLGRYTKMSRTSIINIEAGKQRFMIHDIRAMAIALQLPMEKFLRGIIL